MDFKYKYYETDLSDSKDISVTVVGDLLEPKTEHQKLCGALRKWYSETEGEKKLWEEMDAATKRWKKQQQFTREAETTAARISHQFTPEVFLFDGKIFSVIGDDIRVVNFMNLS